MPADSDSNLNLMGVRWGRCAEYSRVKELVLMEAI